MKSRRKRKRNSCGCFWNNVFWNRNLKFVCISWTDFRIHTSAKLNEFCGHKPTSTTKKEFFANLACFGCTSSNLAYSKFPLSKSSLHVKFYKSSLKIWTMTINISHHQVYSSFCLNIRAFAPFLCWVDKAFLSFGFFGSFCFLTLVWSLFLFQTVLVHYYYHGKALARTESNFWLWNLCQQQLLLCCSYGSVLPSHSSSPSPCTQRGVASIASNK